jgi:BirA family biotin operon repressor/biotin-[acetyl-CoA-carboxylase] ligase
LVNPVEYPPCFKTTFLAPHLEVVDTIGSTNAEVKRLFQEGMEPGFILAARSQSSGIGRKGRPWLSPEGGLYFSIIMSPPLGLSSAPLLNLLCACAVCQSLRILGVADAQVKWPNDVLVGDAKISGILSEVLTEPAEGVIIGIGLNLNCPVSQMPAGLRWPTTSVIDELGKETPILEMLCFIVNQIDRYLVEVNSTGSFEKMLKDWRKFSGTLGKRVRVQEAGKELDGLAVDIGADGALIVESDEGQIEVLLGDVHHLKPAE